MRIIVTGLECSGTKWMAELLGRHPSVAEVAHTSIPEFRAPGTRYPSLYVADAVVWMVRYEPFRLKSVDANNYDDDRDPAFIPPLLYEEAVKLYSSSRFLPVMVSYEGMVSPIGKLVFRNLLERLGLEWERYPWDSFDPEDANAKYFYFDGHEKSR